MCLDDGVDGGELAGPLHVVEERAHVVAVIVRRVGLRVVGRRQCRQLVAVHGVEVEEALHLLSTPHRTASHPHTAW